MRILLVEDDPLLGDGLAAALGAQGFVVDWFTDGQQADAALAAAPYDAVVLDLGLPGPDGLHWLGRWREAGQHTPVLVLTARDALEQRIAGLDRGADDYLIKPIDAAELAARLRAVRRRLAGRSEPVWTHGPLSYRPEAKSTLWQGQPVELTARETALLELFLSHPQRVLSKEVLLEKLYSWDQAVESNVLEVHIHHLRKKLHPKLVKTVRGLGYALGPVEELA